MRNEECRERVIALARAIADAVDDRGILLSPWELDCAFNIARVLVACDISGNFEEESNVVQFPAGTTLN